MDARSGASNAIAVDPHAREARRTREISFDRHDVLRTLYGEYDRNLEHIEKRFGVVIRARAGSIHLEGPSDRIDLTENLLRDLHRRAVAGHEIGIAAIDDAIGLSAQPVLSIVDDDVTRISSISIKTRKKTIVPRTVAQARYMRDLQSHEMIFALGPAGTGKTYIAVAQAVSQLITGSVQKLILSRPAVEAGERLGFLPGDMKEKVDPYLRPLYDALHDCLPAEQVERRIASGEIEVAPIAFMRGRTLADAFIILDEAQNTTPSQMKMFLTRFGENSRMVICGDPKQTDLPGGPAMSGLADAIGRLEGVDGIATSRFGAGDVVRHPIVGRIVEAYEGRDA